MSWHILFLRQYIFSQDGIPIFLFNHGLDHCIEIQIIAEQTLDNLTFMELLSKNF
ncbi:MAG: hypothetical protein SVO26_00900 [Chloroflexota bacterium]|nr:hypothetical protein [Chloroflexota bacterium]